METNGLADGDDSQLAHLMELQLGSKAADLAEEMGGLPEHEHEQEQQEQPPTDRFGLPEHQLPHTRLVDWTVNLLDVNEESPWQEERTVGWDDAPSVPPTRVWTSDFGVTTRPPREGVREIVNLPPAEFGERYDAMALNPHATWSGTFYVMADQTFTVFSRAGAEVLSLRVPEASVFSMVQCNDEASFLRMLETAEGQDAGALAPGSGWTKYLLRGDESSIYYQKDELLTCVTPVEGVGAIEYVEETEWRGRVLFHGKMLDTARDRDLQRAARAAARARAVARAGVTERLTRLQILEAAVKLDARHRAEQPAAEPEPEPSVLVRRGRADIGASLGGPHSSVPRGGMKALFDASERQRAAELEAREERRAGHTTRAEMQQREESRVQRLIVEVSNERKDAAAAARSSLLSQMTTLAGGVDALQAELAKKAAPILIELYTENVRGSTVTHNKEEHARLIKVAAHHKVELPPDVAGLQPNQYAASKKWGVWAKVQTDALRPAFCVALIHLEAGPESSRWPWIGRSSAGRRVEDIQSYPDWKAAVWFWLALQVAAQR